MTTVRALLIAVEAYDPAARLPDLAGTVDRARRFRDWLVTVRKVDPGAILFCASPKVADAGFDATVDGITAAVTQLCDEGQDQTEQLFVFHTGHGLSVTEGGERADVVVASSYTPSGPSARSFLKLQELRRYLAEALGPGLHFWFVDACRVATNRPVPDQGYNPRRSRLGNATAYALYAAAPGAPARNASKFPAALVDALAGAGTAKVWRDKQWWVSFPRLVAAVREAVKPDPVDEDPGPDPGLIALLEGVPDVDCTADVRGAQATDRFVLRLSGGDRPIVRVDFSGPSHAFTVPPGDYFVELEGRRGPVGSVDPEPGAQVSLYVGRALVFDTTPAPPMAPAAAAPAAAPPQIVLEPDPARPDLAWQVRPAGGGPAVIAGAGRLRVRRPGMYDVSVIDHGEVIGRQTLGLRPGDRVRASDILKGATYLDRLWEPSAAGTPLIHLDRLIPGAGAGPAVADPDPALVLSLIGTAAICDIAPYADALSGLRTFDDLGPDAAAIYLLTKAEGLSAGVGADPLPTSAVPGAAGAYHQAWPVEPGPQRLRLSPVKGPEVVVATHALPGRATLVVVTGDSALTVRQYTLVPGHLALPGGGPGERGQPGNPLAETRFAQRVQRRFGDGRPCSTPDDDPADLAAWDRLVGGDWPDPLTALVAGYELVRRGWLDQQADAVHGLVSGLRQSCPGQVDIGIVDLDVLEALAAGRPVTVPGPALVLDGTLAGARPASEPGFETALDYGSPWTLWHRWPAPASTP